MTSDRFDSLWRSDGVRLLGLELFDRLRGGIEAFDEWDQPAELAQFSFTDVPKGVKEQRGEGFTLALNFSATALDGHPLQHIVGWSAPPETVALALVVETWADLNLPDDALDGAVCDDDRRVEGRLVQLLLRDGDSYCDIYIRGAGWLSEFTEHDVSVPWEGRVVESLRRSLGLASGAVPATTPTQTASSLVLAMLSLPLVDPATPGRVRTLYTEALCSILETPVNLMRMVTGPAGAKMHPHATVLRPLLDSADWDEARRALLEHVDDNSMLEWLAGSFEAVVPDLHAQPGEVLAWCDGSMLEQFVGGEMVDVETLRDAVARLSTSGKDQVLSSGEAAELGELLIKLRERLGVDACS